MGGGAARLEQGALLDHDDVSPAELGEVVGDAATYDARANDDDSGMLRKGDGRHFPMYPNQTQVLALALSADANTGIASM